MIGDNLTAVVCSIHKYPRVQNGQESLETGSDRWKEFSSKLRDCILLRSGNVTATGEFNDSDSEVDVYGLGNVHGFWKFLGSVAST